MLNKIRNHIERWNIWRKHNLNSPVHKILVLFGLYSPTFQMTWTAKEQKEYEEELKQLHEKYDIYGRMQSAQRNDEKETDQS